MDIQDQKLKTGLDAWIRTELPDGSGGWSPDEGRSSVRKLVRSLADAELLHQGWDAPPGCGDIRKQLYLHYAVAKSPVGGFGLCLASHLDISTAFVNKKGSESQKQAWIPGALRGDLILALAMTEPGSGSDLQGIEFRAQKTDEGWILNGTKRGVTNLPFADAAIVLVRTREERSPFSYSLFLLPMNKAGVGREAALPTLGYEGCLGGVTAENVVLTDGDLIGPVGTGLISLMKHLETERLIVSARMLGMAEYMFDRMRAEARDDTDMFRRAGHDLAEQFVKLTAFRSYMHLCVHNYCEGSFPAKDSAALKYMGSQLLKSMSDAFMLSSARRRECFGDHPAERCYREASGLSLAGGSEEIMLSLIGQELENQVA